VRKLERGSAASPAREPRRTLHLHRRHPFHHRLHLAFLLLSLMRKEKKRREEKKGRGRENEDGGNAARAGASPQALFHLCGRLCPSEEGKEKEKQKEKESSCTGVHVLCSAATKSRPDSLPRPSSLFRRRGKKKGEKKKRGKRETYRPPPRPLSWSSAGLPALTSAAVCLALDLFMQEKEEKKKKKGKGHRTVQGNRPARRYSPSPRERERREEKKKEGKEKGGKGRRKKR